MPSTASLKSCNSGLNRKDLSLLPRSEAWRTYSTPQVPHRRKPPPNGSGQVVPDDPQLWRVYSHPLRFWPRSKDTLAGARNTNLSPRVPDGASGIFSRRRKDGTGSRYLGPSAPLGCENPPAESEPSTSHIQSGILPNWSFPPPLQQIPQERTEEGRDCRVCFVSLGPCVFCSR